MTNKDSKRGTNYVQDFTDANGKISLKGKVYICSPLSAPTPEGMKKNAATARLMQNKISEMYNCRAVAPHGYLPFILDDTIPEERELAIQFDNHFLIGCDSLLVCSDTISNGMRGEILLAVASAIPVYKFCGSTNTVEIFDLELLEK